MKKQRWGGVDKGEISALALRALLALFLSDILHSSLLIQAIMHDDMTQTKAGFKKGLFTTAQQCTNPHIWSAIMN